MCSTIRNSNGLSVIQQLHGLINRSPGKTAAGKFFKKDGRFCRKFRGSRSVRFALAVHSHAKRSRRGDLSRHNFYMRILHLAPHPDDELLGCPAILLALRQAGHTIDNLACSLGQRNQEERRARELQEACDRVGFNLLIPDPLPRIDSAADPAEAESEVREALETIMPQYDLLVSPSPHDLHPGHEAVGRAVRTVLRERDGVWWQWGLWADLPLPSVLYPFGEEEMKTILWALEAHGEELARNDYRRLFEGRASANSVLGPERLWGFGTEGIDAPYAEVVTEVRHQDGAWKLGAPRLLDAEQPLLEDTSELERRPSAYLRGRTREEEPLLRPDVTEWIEAPSVGEMLRGQE